MAGETATTNAPAAVESAAAPASTAGVGTQSSNTQAEATQTKSNPLNTQTTNDVAVTKPAPKADEPVVPAKLDYNEKISKYISGEMSDEDYKAIEDAGLSTEQFKMMGEAQKTIQLNNNNTLYNLVGGQKSYEGLKSFAAEHLSEDEIDQFNGALKSGNMKLAQIAVLGLKAMADQERGKNPQKRISAEDFGSDNVPAYTSQQELIKDLNSRQYRNDPEFRAKVDVRRNKSGF